MKTVCILLFALTLTAAGVAGATPGAPALVVTPPAAGPASPAPPAIDVGAALPADQSAYILSRDDVLQMSVLGETTMQNVFLTVTPDGTVNAPVVGSIVASGRTIEALKQEIGKRFIDMDYLRNPVVQLTLYTVHKMKVRVLGQVNRPGLQLMREGDKVDQAIAEAGSFIPDTSNLARATITRQGATEAMPVNLDAFFNGGDLTQNIEVKDGDTIYIPEDTENRFYVMGYVNQPRMFPLKPTTTVTEAISQAGSVSQRGSLKRTVVIRKSGTDGKPERIPVDVAKIIETGDTSIDMRLQPGDVVYVPETKKPNLGEIGQLISAFSNIAYLNRIGWF